MDELEKLYAEGRSLNRTASNEVWLGAKILTESIIDGLTLMKKLYKYTLGDRLLNKSLELISVASQMVEMGCTPLLWLLARALRRDLLTLLSLCVSANAMPISKYTRISIEIVKLDPHLK